LSEEARLSGLMAEDSPINLETIPENSIGLAGQLRMEGILQEIVAGGSRVGGFAAGSNGFTVNRTNRRLFEQLALGAMLGLAAAIVLSVAIAGIFNRRLGRSIRAITKSMGSVAAGSRTEPFPELQITELNDISGSAAALQLRLAQEERLRRQWTMDLAHDLRTPIANIRAQAEAMSDGLLEPGARRLENLAINARHLSQLADNLLLLARMESPEYELNLTEVALGDLASTIYSAFDARMVEEHRTLSFEAATGIIAADRQLAERALGNLVENALRHGHGAIFCSFSEATLSVRNNGIISEEVQELVFDRLYKGAPDRSGDGHGLGLAIVKAISDLHGWTVQVDSASDEVVFSIHLRTPAKP
jgi:signal transduction histidine kinase